VCIKNSTFAAKYTIVNTELFIAKRLTFDKESKASFSRPIIRIAIIGIALGLVVMIISVAVVTGFKNEIRKRVVGFGSHIHIINFDSNISFETQPISKKQDFYPGLADSIEGIDHIQIFATKPGIIKTDKDIEGVIVKGIGSDFDWHFFNENLVEGHSFNVNDTLTSNEVLISRHISNLLGLEIKDEFAMFFIDRQPRARRFKIAGIYETSLEEFDKQFILADIKHIIKLNNWKDDEISGFEILISDYRDIDYLTRQVHEIAGLSFDEDGYPLKVRNIKHKYPQIFDWLTLLDMNVLVILILMVVVAGFNMVSGLIILILDRTNMIGILKSLGLNNKGIRKIFLYQSAFLITKGLLWGNLIGILLAFIQYKTQFLQLDQASYFIDYVPVNFNILYFILLNAGTLLITLTMLVFPSLIIANISPSRTVRFN